MMVAIPELDGSTGPWSMAAAATRRTACTGCDRALHLYRCTPTPPHDMHDMCT
jgi:hypothetical protein